MTSVYLMNNQETLHFSDPNGKGIDYLIHPESALYDPETRLIHFLKHEGDLYQLHPIKTAEYERNRKIVKIGMLFASVFGIDFTEDDDTNEIANFFFEKGLNISLNYLVDCFSEITAKTTGYGYYCMRNDELIIDFPLLVE